jgi:hypothetical protein
MADTNYRIDMDNATVRSMAEADDFDGLLAGDQVCLCLCSLCLMPIIYLMSLCSR